MQRAVSRVHEPDSLQVITKDLLLLLSQAICLSSFSPSADHTKTVIPSRGEPGSVPKASREGEWDREDRGIQGGRDREGAGD